MPLSVYNPMEQFTYTFRMGDMHIAVISEEPLAFDENNSVFLCPAEKADVVYYIHCGFCPPQGQVLYKGVHYTVYGQGDVRERVFSALASPLKLSYWESVPDVFHLYGEKTDIHTLCNLLIRSFFALEVPLLQRHGFLLHASLIQWNGQGIAFSAPSGTGKSTQATLWEEGQGAEILNGDRALLRNTEEGTMAYGSVFSGSSGIYTNTSVPLRMIVLLEQASENRLCPISKGQAFIRLYRESLANPWDSFFTKNLTKEIETLLNKTPVYVLQCRPDQEAVELVRDALNCIDI